MGSTLNLDQHGRNIYACKFTSVASYLGGNQGVLITIEVTETQNIVQASYGSDDIVVVSGVVPGEYTCVVSIVRVGTDQPYQTETISCGIGMQF